MANPFGDEPTGSAQSAAKFGPNPFGDDKAERQGYLGASVKAGLLGAGGAIATAIDSVLPTTSEADLAVLYKNDPNAEADRAKISGLNGTYSRMAKNASAKAEQVMGPDNLTPEAQATAKKEYATTDLGNAAWADPTKVVGDAIQSIPSSAVLLGTMVATRNAGASTFASARAAGMSEAAATAAAARAASQTMATVGGASEGALGGVQQYNEGMHDAAKMTPEQWAKSPEYRRLRNEGYDHDGAVAIASQTSAFNAGVGAGLSDAAINAAGGAVLGKFLGHGKGMGARVAASAGEQTVTEAAQSPAEQLSGNAAKKQYLDPSQQLDEKLLESSIAGGVVGGVSGAPMGILGGGKHVEQGKKMLDGAAIALEMEEATGFAPEAARTVENISGQAAKKPKLNGVQSRVAVAAQAAGVEPVTALTVMQLESGGRDVSNSKSSAGGLFQIIDSTWESLGGGDRADEATQIRNGVAYLAQVSAQIKQATGLTPSPAEVYMGHMLGPKGAMSLMNAAQGNPDGSFLDQVRKWDSKNADAIVNNNRFTGMTNKQVYDKIADKVGKESQRLGMDAEMNRIAKVSPTSDTVPNTITQTDDDLDMELSALLSEDEMNPLTEAEEHQAEVESIRLPGAVEDVQEEHRQLDAANPVAEAPEENPKLPAVLAGANPRYAIGQQNFTMTFDNDLDKAAYVIANNASRSKADADYLEFVMHHTGMTEKEARDYGAEVRAVAKAVARAQKDPDVTSIHVSTSRATLPDSYVSVDEAKTRKAYDNPNDRVAISYTPIAAASDPTAVGESLSTRKLQPGEVVALNIEGAHSPAKYVEAVQQTLQDWVSRFMPNSVMIATFRTMDPTKVAGYGQFNKRGRGSASKRVGPGYIHQLNLRNATNLGVTDDGSHNASVQRKIAYSMAHEFGHALVEEKFTEGMTPEMVAKFENLGLEEFFTEEDLAGMPPQTASVLREYNALKRRVLTDPSMKARDFINQWLSPWKTAHGGGANQGAISFAKMYLGAGVVNNMDRYTASQMARSMDPFTNILSPHEYMAEQFSRYAYSRSLFKNSAFDTAEFFKGVFEALSKFFKLVKNKGIAEPGVKFADWVDGLTEAGKNANNPTVPKAEQPARTAGAKPRGKTKPTTSTPLVQSAVEEAPAAGVPQSYAKTVTKNVGGRDVTIAQTTDTGQWVQIDAAGLPTGGPLGMTEQIATGVLAAQARTREAAERNNKASRTGYQAQKPLAPSLVPRVQEDTVTEATGEFWSSEAQAEAEHLLRTDPMLKELRTAQPELYAELRELVKAQKLEEFRWEVQTYVSDEVADKMRFDTDNPEHMMYKDMGDRLQEALPRAGLNGWFKESLRKVANHKYYTMTMTQMAYANPFSGGLQHVNNMMNEFKTFKARLEFRAVENSDAWSKLGKEQRGLLEKAMRAEHFRGEHMFDLRQINKTWRFVPNETTVTYANKLGLDDSTVKIWMDVKNSYVQHMNVLQNSMAAKIRERLSDRPALMKKRYHELSQMFEQIRSTPFVPQTRFGEYAIQVTDSQVEGNKIVHVEFFESAAERDAAKIELAKHIKPGQKIQDSRYSPTSAILRTLPPETLSFFAEEMNLTTEQRKEMREIADVVTRNKQTRKYSNQLAAISGANKNLLQNYAEFMAHDSNNIAKLHYRSRLNDGINQMRLEQEGFRQEGDTASFDEMRKLINFAESYKDHMLNPAQEFHMLRSLVVLKMLWGNIKTAVANLNSLANLYGLAARQGERGSSAAMAGKVLGQSIMNLGKRVLRQPVEGGEVFTDKERWALDQAKVRGLLDETFAAQLASFSGNSTLDRLNMGGFRSKLDQVVKIGMLPQHAVENYTRRVTLLQQFNTYSKQGMDQRAAFMAAQNDLFLLQGNNTQANRPAFMRGKASLFFIYYGYMQNMLYLMSGAQERSRNVREAYKNDPTLTIEEAKKHGHIKLGGETLKMWMAYAVLGGLMGLPGAEDIDKILGLVAKKMFGAHFSLKEYAFELGNAISQQSAKLGIDVNPRSIVHGNMSDFNLFGLMPSMDISSSMSLGAALPGMGSVDKLDKKGGAGDFLLGALGPFGSVFKDLGKAFSDDPSMMNRAGLIMPNTVKSWVKAFQEHREGVLLPSGGKVTYDRKTQELRDLTMGETLVRFGGFTPSIISANKELHWMQKDKADYWTGRRNQLTAQMWEAHRQKDREAEADVRDAIREFNDAADPKLRLTSKDVAASLKKHQANLKLDEKRTAASKRFKGMYKEMEEDFMGASPK